MTTETPFTVADLRTWAKTYRNFASLGGSAEHPASVCLAMAAAFDALADGIEAAEHDGRKLPTVAEFDAGAASEARHIGRILRGEKLK